MTATKIANDSLIEILRSSKWRRWLALLTLATILCLFATSASHHHETDAEDRDCAVCSAVIHQVVGTVSVAPTATSFFVHLYFVSAAQLASVVVYSPRLTPPICGPPSLT